MVPGPRSGLRAGCSGVAGRERDCVSLKGKDPVAYNCLFLGPWPTICLILAIVGLLLRVNRIASFILRKDAGQLIPVG